MKSVRTLAPIRYPKKILNAAGNFYTHTCEGCTPQQQAENDKKIRANRGVPYLFLKPGEGAVIGNNHAIVIPARPRPHRLGDRVRHGDRPSGPLRLGQPGPGLRLRLHGDHRHVRSRRAARAPAPSDWFVGKGHETFAPMGPWIVPKEFYGDPMKRLHQQLSIDGVKVQEAKAGDMIHNIWELIEYGSSIITLFPGDVINSGTTGGTSSGALQARAPARAISSRARRLRPRSKVSARSVIRSSPASRCRPTSPGAQLPAVGTYRPAGAPPPPQ